ncbi:protein crumbs homolog 2b [Aplochiton taeniatus]
MELRTVLLTMMMFKFGLLCTAAAERCLSSPCHNNATCLDRIGDYVCLCPQGPVWYMGKDCDELYDPCVLAPCANCTSTLGTDAFTCHCAEGFAGLNCSLEVDECQSSPCEGVKPRCVDRVDGYTCHCPLGRAGEDCQDNVTVCSDQPCRNQATCLDVPDGGHQCRCAPGYQGRDCEQDVDECHSQPCQNGAICKDGVNRYQCFCVPGFQGSHCGLDINECASRPCENNGTCADEVDHYRCDCALGFKGVNCEVEINECEVHPCHNGATCRDHVGAYSCECVAGFQGHDCEVNVDECASWPCLNEGVCVDLVNSYACECGGTGFVGELCEQDIPECVSDPCQHGATCLEGVNQYSCLCWPGYEGENCQVDVDECAWEPCENGGECFQRSNLMHYGLLSELDQEFSYEEAAGFLCHCLPGFTGESCSVNVDECESGPCANGGTCQDLVNSYLCDCTPGFTGVHCEVDVDECASRPCQNGASCVDGVASYTCRCAEAESGREPWGGRDCDTPLTGCQQHGCQHGATCVPRLTEGGHHSFSCRCPPAFTGDRCTIPTTFSFSTEGYALVRLPDTGNQSRAEQQAHHLPHPGLHVQLRFRTTLPDNVLFYRGTTQHHVTLEIVAGLLQARVQSGKVLKVTHPQPVNDGEWYQASVAMDERLALVVKGPGCEDAEGCTLDNKGHNDIIFLQPSSFSWVYVGGAPQKYLSNTASKTGFLGCMEDLRVDHRLVLPQDLPAQQVQDMRLGCNKTEWCRAEPCSEHGRCVDLWISYSCDCHRPYYGDSCEEEYPSWTFGHENSTSYAPYSINTTHGENFTVSFFLRSLKPSGLLLQLGRKEQPYLTIYLRNGIVFFYSKHTAVPSETKFITNGRKELVTVKVRHGNVVWPEAGIQVALARVSVEAGDVAFIGGLPAGMNTASWGGAFKGCLQDIRLDHIHLTMGDHTQDGKGLNNSMAENVLHGCQTDNTCKGDPCLNGGSCTVTWNNYVCDCPTTFTGRTCETRLWCITHPCDEGGQCFDLPDGYECLTNATFLDNALQYRANGSLVEPVTSVAMALRTREENGVLLRATQGDQVFCLGLLNSTLLVKLRSGTSQLLAFTSEWPVADGAWHSVHLAMVNPQQEASRWHLTVDGQGAGTSMGFGANLNFLNDTTVWLAENLTGCLGEVRVGGVYLPLLDLQDAPQAASFTRQGGQAPELGCTGAPVCEAQPCLNQGTCLDIFNLFNCSCEPGWEGQLCQTDTDDCAAGPCVYGRCIDLLGGHQCECQRGYGGRECQEELEDCLEHSCENGGSCTEASGSYRCVCPPGYSGKRCQHFPPGECEENTACLNGGVCMDGASGVNCTCKPGYTGDRCETETDECESAPCLSGGTCQNRVNSFQCVCLPGFTGTQCESIKQEQKEHVPWLVVAIPLTSLCVLVAIITLFCLIITARKKRQSEGTYSPSSQEVAGARLEMGNVLKVPPEERLI